MTSFFKKNFYRALVLIIPFFILLTPKMNFGFTHLKPDELLVLLWFPLSFANFLKRDRYTVKGHASFYFIGLFVLFGMFLFGLFWGLWQQNSMGWSYVNIKYISGPLLVCLYAVVFQYWISQAKLNNFYIILSLIVSIVISVIIGFYGLYNPNFALNVTELYSKGTLELASQDRFNMALRAMSVYSGYDVASVVYAIGTLLCLYTYVYSSRRIIEKLILLLLGLIIALGIISAARTGFILLIVGALYILIFGSKFNSKKLKMILILSVILMHLPIIQIIYPEAKTFERFEEAYDVITSFGKKDFNSISSLNSLYNEHFYAIDYPQGIDAIFGYGDKGIFISDSGYVNVFVKYGIFGVFCLFLFFIKTYSLSSKNFPEVKKIIHNNIAITGFLPVLMLVFSLAAIKGNLYFISERVGYLYGIIIAMCIYENQLYVKAKFNSENDPSKFSSNFHVQKV